MSTSPSLLVAPVLPRKNRKYVDRIAVYHVVDDVVDRVPWIATSYHDFPGCRRGFGRSLDTVHPVRSRHAAPIAEAREKLLSRNQCRDLASKLLKAILNIQEIVSQFEGPSVGAFRPALQDFHRIAEKSRLLVTSCCKGDWYKAAPFQLKNEEAFRELLLEVGLCYNAIYELAKAMSEANGLEMAVEDLRQSAAFGPASATEVVDDQESLQRRLEDLARSAGSSHDGILAKYLHRRLIKGVSEERKIQKDCIMYDAGEMKSGTWDVVQNPIGGGAGAFCVFSTKLHKISCAKKLFLRMDGGAEDPTFRKEAALLESLNHPNIVKFFCCGSVTEGENNCFIGMELMEMSLADLLMERRNRNAGRFPMAVALDIIMQIARGMLYLHDLCVAHRDLKPQNVVVSKTASNSFSVKLLDFGMSRTKTQASKSNTVSAKNIGTASYRAPEAFSDAAYLSAAAHGKQRVKWFRADVYSFAVTCYAILSLERPYENAGMPSKLYKKLMTGTRPVLPTDCPETLSDLLKECWAVNMNARPKFSEICERLEKFKHDELLRESPVAAFMGSLTFERVDVSSSYAYIGTMLRERSQLRTPVQHVLFTVVARDEYEDAAINASDDELEAVEAPTTEGLDLAWIASQKKTFVVSKAEGDHDDQTMKYKLKKACEEFCKLIDLTRIPTTEEREQAMQDFVGHLYSTFEARYNVMVVYPQHLQRFQEYAHCSITLQISDWKFLSVQVYVFKRGDFTLYGDPGFINWCFKGNHKRKNYEVSFWDVPHDETKDVVETEDSRLSSEMLQLIDDLVISVSSKFI